MAFYNYYRSGDITYQIVRSEYADEFARELTDEYRGCFSCEYAVQRKNPFGDWETYHREDHRKLYYDKDYNVYLTNSSKKVLFNLIRDKIN